MVTMHMADQHCIDITETRIVRSGDGAAGIVEDARTVGILEDQCPVEAAELPVYASQRRHLDVFRRLCRQRPTPQYQKRYVS